MKKQLLKTADIVLIFVILLFALLWIGSRCTNEPCEAVIYADGKEYMRIDLEDSKAQTIEVNNVHIYIQDGRIEINGSDCPDGLCMNFSPIYTPGSTVACVPNRVVITIVANKNYIDGVTG